MDETTAQRIFDPFFTTKQRGQGTGLGLAMVQAIVDSHRGKITVSSVLERGSTFNVFLPAISREDLPVDDFDSPSAIPRGKERILFVDDEKVLVELGCEMLHKLGYRVTGLMDSPSALRLLRDRPQDFDILITDLTMPRLTGLELARETRRVRPNLPVVLCTGFSESISRGQGRPGEIDRIIMKPLTMKELGVAIRQALGDGSPEN
jgi:CheY-like chemotaxis protein